jgi:hypothetical protein
MEIGMASLRKQLESLESLRESFGAIASREKLQLLGNLEQRSLGSAADVARLHEMLCFMRAWPDDAKLLATVDRMLRNFSARPDLVRFARALENSGIAGTDIRFSFYLAIAEWLAERCGDSLRIDWKAFENADRLSSLLESLVLFSERGALRQFFLDVPDWIDRMRDDDETDAVFLVRRLAALGDAGGLRESIYDMLDTPFHLSSSDAVPTRTYEYLRPKTIRYQQSNINRGSVDLRRVSWTLRGTRWSRACGISMRSRTQTRLT